MTKRKRHELFYDMNIRNRWHCMNEMDILYIQTITQEGKP